jgi:sRNA-binding protein
LTSKPLSNPLKEAANSLGDLLFERHPKAFIHPRFQGKGMRPLKVGIDKDIKAAYPDITKRVIALFLAHYTSSPFYRRCGTMVGTVRIDLAGDAVSVVNPDQARHSERHLTRIVESQHRAPNTTGCVATGKLSFDSADQAATAGRAAITRTGGDPALAKGFRCKHCGKFHWGNRLPPTTGLR